MADAAARTRVAVLISGTGTNMAALLYASRADDCPYEIVLVASNNPDAPGLALAKAEGIKTFAKSHKGIERATFDALLNQALRKVDAQVVACAGYMRILSPTFVETWRDRLINIHPSLLPKYPGLDTHARALANGDKWAGCTVHLVSEEVDAGQVLGQTRVAVLPGDTPDTLAARVLLAEHQLYPRTLAGFVSRANDPDWLLQRVTALAQALPMTHLRPSHGAPGWRVGTQASGKYFAHFNDQHHGHDAIALLVKVDGQDELDALCAQDPDAYFKPAYYGAAGWIGIRLNRPGVDWDHIANWLERSWRSVAPAKIAAQLP